MKPRSAARLAWSLWALAVLGLASGGVWGFINRQTPREESALVGVVFGLVALALATVGALVASRRAENPIGWVFLGQGVAFAVGAGLAGEYAAYGLLTDPGTLPAARHLAWLANFVIEGSGLLLGSFIFVLLLFPDGRLPSKLWRIVAWPTALVAALSQLGTAFGPEQLPSFPGVRNPLRIGVLGTLLEVAGDWLILALLVASLAAAASLVVRFRRSRGTERQQLKWIVGAGAFLALATTTGPFWWLVVPTVGEVVWPLLFAAGLAAIPVAVGIAILRYRLYDIDRIINRTVVYGILTAALGGVYAGVVVGMGTVVGRSSVVVAVSTLLVAALFRPARRWVQGLIDRRFYRQKVDAARALEVFTTRLREEVDLDSLTSDLMGVVRSTMQPAHASLWLAETQSSVPSFIRNDSRTLGR
ncbi:MAG: hypothetical protein ACRDIX_01040 [Actinomycetota bacterium]